MNCFMCKGDLEVKKVNYVVDLEDTIIVIKGVQQKYVLNVENNTLMMKQQKTLKEL